MVYEYHRVPTTPKQRRGHWTNRHHHSLTWITSLPVDRGDSLVIHIPGDIFMQDDVGDSIKFV